MEPINKILAVPEGELLAALTLLGLYLIAMHAVVGRYYRRTSRSKWKFTDGMSEFPFLHFNAREWGLTLVVFAAYLTLIALVVTFKPT